MPDAQITTEVLTNEARMLQQMIIKLDEQLEEIQMSRQDSIQNLNLNNEQN